MRASAQNPGLQRLCLCAALCGGAWMGAAQAQTASQITPPSFAPPVRSDRPAPVVIPDATGVIAPAGSEALQVTPGALMIDDAPEQGDRAVAAALAAIRTQLTGKRVRVADIFAAAHALETAYARSGHVLVRVLVPAQSLADGATLRLVVIDGIIERIDTSAVPRAVRTRVARLLGGLVDRRGVTIAEIERALLLSGEVPGVTLQSTIAAGSAPGTSILLIGARWHMASGFFSFDNMLPPSLGGASYGIGFDLNGVAGLGEQIYLRASGLPTTGDNGFLGAKPRNRALAAGIVVPIGGNGASAAIEVTESRTSPRFEPGLPGIGSLFQRSSLRLHYPVVRRRALTMDTEVALDLLSEKVRIIDPVLLPLSHDRFNVVRVTGDIGYALANGARFGGRAIASFGVDGLGARSAADADPLEPLSRAGADAAFRKFEVSASAYLPMATHLAFSLRARGQTGFGDALFNAEQIGLATLDGLSPLPSGSLQGDRGYVVRGEATTPFAAPIGRGFASVAPYGFGAFGGVAFQEPTAVERPGTDANAYGAGIRAKYETAENGAGIGATIEWGRAHVADRASTDLRISISFSKQL